MSILNLVSIAVPMFLVPAENNADVSRGVFL
jgi:hypothetical protein